MVPLDNIVFTKLFNKYSRQVYFKMVAWIQRRTNIKYFMEANISPVIDSENVMLRNNCLAKILFLTKRKVLED